MLDLVKGEKLDITKGTNITKIKVALGWDAADSAGGVTCDLDAAVFVRNAAGKITSAKDVVYFKALNHPSGAISHSGDELTGGKVGDDEVITFDLEKVPTGLDRLSIVINIFDALKKGQNFGQVKKAFARIDNAEDGAVLGRLDLTEDHSKWTALHVGDVYRHNGEWRFDSVAVGKAYGSLNDFLNEWS
jgi:tellurium resistance protein TerD